MFSTPTGPQVTAATAALAALNSALTGLAEVSGYYARDPYIVGTLMPLAAEYQALFLAILTAELAAAQAALETALAPFFANASQIASIAATIDVFVEYKAWQYGFPLNSASAVGECAIMQTLFSEVVG
jgi:hypothetical protein